jgi:cyanophycinase
MPRAVADFNAHLGDNTSVGVLLDVRAPQAAFDSALVKQLLGCSGYFFTGGLQSQITRVLRPNGTSTPALDAIRSRYRRGALVAGTSAGAAIMSDPMIVGGNSVAALNTGLAGKGVNLGPGLGFLNGALADQHFLARGRIGRLLVAILQSEQHKIGFGIDENTALVVDGHTAHVEGASGVVLVDGRAARRDSAGNGGSGLRIHLMGTGDNFDLATHRLVVDQRKRAIAKSGRPVVAPDSLFGSYQLLHLLHALGQSADTAARVVAEGYEFVFAKDAGFGAVASDGAGVAGTPAGLTVGPFRVTMRKTR